MSIGRKFLMTGLVLVALILAFAGRHVGAADAVVPLPSAIKAQLDKYLGAGVVGEPVAGSPLMAAADYLPPKGSTLTYRVLEKDEEPRSETHKVEETTDPQFAPGWRYVADRLGALYFQKASDGGASIVGEEDRDNEVLSRFTPGEPLMIVGLKPGESRKVAVNVQVAELSNTKKITHKGMLDVTYTYIGAYRVTVPAGTFDAALIRWDYQGSVGPADIEQTDYRFIAPHAGMVAMVQNRHVSAMLIYNDKRKLGKLLQSRK
jgi:hypothetical protein